MIEIASGVGPARIDIAYERLGDPTAPPVLLVMGLGAQLLGWPDGLCDELVKRGLHLIRFDNRDAGQSTHFSGMPDLPAVMAGNHALAPYRLSDMAGDTFGLLDALGLDSVHLVGASMGGFIAQTMTIEQPRRVRSLTSIMSTTGSPTVGQMHPEALAMFALPPIMTRAQAIERGLHASSVIGSPGFQRDVEGIADRVGRSYDRAFDPPGMARQGAAVIASGDRTARLREVRTPALVLHGDRDKMCDVSGGRATAEAIEGAELVIIEGMGHDLPRALWPDFATRIAALVERAERARTVHT
jgi:pimeloyl-ACP methyl ester carboxylesterase